MVGFLEADTTPKKKTNKKKGKNGLKILPKKTMVEMEEQETPIHLPKNVKFLDTKNAEELTVWDETQENVASAPVICFNDLVNPMQLPPADNRPNNKKHLVGNAAQSFNIKENTNFMSSWISGFVELPPHCIKDPECVGDCTQVFFVSECQDSACKCVLHIIIVCEIL